MTIKILLIGGALVFGGLLLREQVPGQKQALRRLLGSVVVVAGVFAVIWPNAVTWVANRVGVGRGTDLVLYVLVMVFLFTTIALYQRLHQLESRLTKLTQALALQDFERPDGLDN